MSVSPPQDTQSFRLSLNCQDQTGLVSAVAACLFDLGADLGDTTFAVLGQQAELICVFDVPTEVSCDDIQASLAMVHQLSQCSPQIEQLTPITNQDGQTETMITHVIIVSGGDRPGLIARMSEGFGSFGANIVRMDSKRLQEAGSMRYAVRFEVAVPPDRELPCLAAAKNTAEELGLDCTYESLRPSALP